VADFLKDCEKRIRPRTLKNYRDYLRLLPFKRRALADLTPREIIQILNAQSPSQREHLHRIARTFFRWCVQQHLLDRSPLENMRPVPMGRSRSRVLTPDELAAVYRTGRAGTGHFPAIVALLCLTGQRRGEISRLEWEWIGPDSITIPAHVSKNGRLHTFPYGEGTAAVLASVPRLSERYVFPAVRQRSPDTTVFNGFSKAKAKFDRESRVTDWTLHDIRRTFATNMQRLGVRIEVTEALLNHVSGTRAGVVGIYQRYQWLPEMRDAMLTFERWLTRLSEPRA
jgi:integrase